MLSGGKKFQRTEKTKFRKNRDSNDYSNLHTKQKHHDKTVYRLLKQEKETII
jgi:hypothetical protein